MPTIYNSSMPKFDPQKHHRRSIRLQGYDYASAGAYYVTIVAWHRECLFGEVVNGEMKLNQVGKIVEWEWLELPKRLRYIELGAHMVMPNHFHGILFIHEHGVGATRQGLTKLISSKGSAQTITNDGSDGSPLRPHGPKPASLGAILAQFKSRVTKRIWKFPEFKETPIWQRNYYEHILRSPLLASPKYDNKNYICASILSLVVFGGGARRAVGVIHANPLLWEQDNENPINANK
jgi:REP element-mobilizing transposase RayT